MATKTIKRPKSMALSPDVEAAITAEVTSGAFATADDVVKAALDALRSERTWVTGIKSPEVRDLLREWTPAEVEAWQHENHDELKKMIAEGLADVRAGRVHLYEPPGDLARDIKKEGRRLLRAKQWLAGRQPRKMQAAQKS